MDTEYQGDLFINGELMRNKKESELAIVRNEYIGFVFQFHYLLNEFNVLENVMLPGLKLNKYSREEVEHRAMEKLKMLGIENEALKKSESIIGWTKTKSIHCSLLNQRSANYYGRRTYRKSRQQKQFNCI